MNARDLDTFDSPAPPGPRPWLGVRFSCGGDYLRVYRSADGTRYTARCPRCGAAVNFRVGQGGTSERFFEVQCGR